MNMKHRILTTVLAAAALVATSPAHAQNSAVPSDAEVRQILVDRIDAQKQSVGIVVGVIEPAGRRVIAYGRLAKDDPRPLNGDTLYEIGSITKVFTSLLLADAVGRGEVALTDPVAKFLPDKVKVPERGGRAITLVDLATHSSGLPRMPTNFAPKDPANPYADYSSENMYAFLSGYQLSRDIGSEYEYSNFGAGLLGHALVLRTRSTDYETLVRARILTPLGMTSTAITLSPQMKARLAAGHSAALQPVANWDLSALAGAGALRSTTNDMLTFLAANLGYNKTPLAAAMAEMLTTRRPTTIPNMTIGLAWHVVTMHGKEIVWHNGGTAGYRTFIGFDPAARVGVVVLSNAGTPAGPDDIGRHLLDTAMPLLGVQAPPKTRTEIAVDPQTLEQYVGRYQLAPQAILTMTREGGRLFTQLTGQPKFEIFAENDQEFFLKVVDAQLTFETDATGKAVAVVLHQNGGNQRAPRIEGEPVIPKGIALDTAVLDGCVGRYEIAQAPGMNMTITRDGAQLFAQITGQPKAEILARSAAEFFFTVADAQITFERDSQGKATALVLHQMGRDLRWTRVE
jgi:D-alanyl-D-alanine-carboxypeptidase/D-alanyl-D-alanine-endopeptidase